MKMQGNKIKILVRYMLRVNVMMSSLTDESVTSHQNPGISLKQYRFLIGNGSRLIMYSGVPGYSLMADDSRIFLAWHEK